MQAKEQIESLFLLRRFPEAISLCQAELDALYHALHGYQRSTSTASGTLGQRRRSSSKGEKRQPVSEEERRRLFSASIPYAALLIQCLFELKRHREIGPFLERFYGGFTLAPYEVAFMALNAKISLGELEEAEKILLACDALYRGKKDEKNKDKEPEERGKENALLPSYVTAQAMSPEQFEDLVELYVSYILLPQLRFNDATKILSERISLLRSFRFQEIQQLLLDAQASHREEAEARARAAAIKAPSNPILIPPNSARQKNSGKKVTFEDEQPTSRRSPPSSLPSSTAIVTPTPKETSPKAPATLLEQVEQYINALLSRFLPASFDIGALLRTARPFLALMGGAVALVLVISLIRRSRFAANPLAALMAPLRLFFPAASPSSTQTSLLPPPNRRV